MRRKPGALLPIEQAILHAAIRLWRTGSAEFHGYEIAGTSPRKPSGDR